MRLRFEVYLMIIVGSSATALCGENESHAKPKTYWKNVTLEELEKDQPTEEVTVQFKVAKVGLLVGGISIGDMPFLLEPDTVFKDKRSKLQVILCTKAVSHLNHLDIKPGYFRGKTVAVTGKVKYMIPTPIADADGNVSIPADSYPHYSLWIEDLDNIRIVP